MITVAKGGTYLSPDVIASMHDAAQKSAEVSRGNSVLTTRDLMILSFVANGETNKLIARKLGIGDQTLKNYMTRLMKKIHVRNRLEAALYYKNLK